MGSLCFFFVSYFLFSISRFLPLSILLTYMLSKLLTYNSFFFLQNAILLVIFTLGVCRSAVLKSTRHSTTSIDPVVAWRLADVFSARQRRSLKVNQKISSIAAGLPSFTMDVRLFGKTQSFLQIAADGTINGTSRCASKYGKWDSV